MVSSRSNIFALTYETFLGEHLKLPLSPHIGSLGDYVFIVDCLVAFKILMFLFSRGGPAFGGPGFGPRFQPPGAR